MKQAAGSRQRAAGKVGPASDTLLPTPDLEVERYELREIPVGPFTLTRRTLFRTLGGGIAVLILAPREGIGQESGGQQRRRGGFGGGQARRNWRPGCTSARTGP